MNPHKQVAGHRHHPVGVMSAAAASAPQEHQAQGDGGGGIGANAVEQPLPQSGPAAKPKDEDEGTADWNSLYCIYMAVFADGIASGIIVPYRYVG